MLFRSSPEQQPVVNFIAKSLALEIVRLGGQVKCYYTNGTWRAAYKKLVGQLLKDHVTLYAYRLQDLDTRPKTNDGTGFFPYTNQGLLEEVIAACKKWDVEPSIIKMLQDAV